MVVTSTNYGAAMSFVPVEFSVRKRIVRVHRTTATCVNLINYTLRKKTRKYYYKRLFSFFFSIERVNTTLNRKKRRHV